MPVAISTARLEARISTDLHSMLKRAAELQGRTMTDFVVSAVQDAAQRAIEQAEVIRLSLSDQECFAQACYCRRRNRPLLWNVPSPVVASSCAPNERCPVSSRAA
jgi:uncharacterized protein (DUF1778 family)